MATTTEEVRWCYDDFADRDRIHRYRARRWRLPLHYRVKPDELVVDCYLTDGEVGAP